MNALQNPTAMVVDDGEVAGLEGSRMAPSAGIGRGQIGVVYGNFGGTGTRNDWPGAEFGIRAPYPHETALSWDEIHCAMRIDVFKH